MIYAVLDNIMIIILTLCSLFASKSPALLIMAAGFLMVSTTYEFFDEDDSSLLFVVRFTLMTVFAVLSGGFAGFIIFFLLTKLREQIRIILGVGLFICAALFLYNLPIAMCIVKALLLVTAFIFLMLFRTLMERMDKRREQENEQLIAANVSEMHEKRLNEQLVLQNFLVEKNARLLERENISRNIHNSVGHSITAAIMTLDAADLLYDRRPGEARKRMNDANERIRGSLESIRRAVRVLDEDGTKIQSGDLKHEMENVINEFVMDTSIQVAKNFSQLMDDIKLPHDHAVFLTGALQEMLTNGVKHGNASEFVVILLGDTAHIRLEVSDNGHSDFDSLNSKSRIESGFGIKKMISYAEKCGGKSSFMNDSGFKGMIELPIVLAEG